jgi:hypothetical protein
VRCFFIAVRYQILTSLSSLLVLPKNQQTPIGEALYKAIVASRLNDKFQEPLYIALELIRAGALHGDLWEHEEISGGASMDNGTSSKVDCQRGLADKRHVQSERQPVYAVVYAVHQHLASRDPRKDIFSSPGLTGPDAFCTYRMRPGSVPSAESSWCSTLSSTGYREHCDS